MCGRATLAANIDRLRQRFGADPTRVAEDYVPQYNIAPSEGLVVVTNAEPETMNVYEWGFLPEWADDPDDVPTPINARSETASENPMFRDAFAHRRCLVLADGFYEWQGSRGRKQPYRVCREDREPFAFAGLWSHWRPDGDAATDGGVTDATATRTTSTAEDRARTDGGTAERWTTTILTTSANAVVEPIHDRMPVILEPDEEDAWLDGSPADAAAVLDPHPPDPLEAYPVSARVNDPSNDDESLLDAIDIGTQSGLDEFGT